MAGILIILLLALVSGLLVSRVSKMTEKQANVESILAVLPQTQCGNCDYPGCRPYAKAIVRREADINQCPPGGTETIKALADLLGRQVKPPSPNHWPSHNLRKETHLALIDETLCIGCVKCIKACPVDAIVGAAKQMHTVLAGECTGCELCIAPCPMDCISMKPVMA